MYLYLRNANQREALPRKSNHKAVRECQKALASLAGVMALKRQANLYHVPPQQDNTYCADERKYKIRKIVDNRQRSVCGKDWGIAKQSGGISQIQNPHLIASGDEQRARLAQHLRLWISADNGTGWSVFASARRPQYVRHAIPARFPRAGAAHYQHAGVVLVSVPIPADGKVLGEDEVAASLIPVSSGNSKHVSPMRGTASPCDSRTGQGHAGSYRINE